MSKTEPKYRDKDWLQEQYWGEKRGTTEIADECGVTSPTIHDWLTRHDIPTRSRAEANILRFGTEGSDHHDEDWLRERYIEEKCSAGEIGSICGVHKDSILSALRRNGIPIRERVEAVKHRDLDTSGRKNPNWMEHLNFHLDPSGYESWTHSYERERNHVLVHRLLAVSEYGMVEIKDMEIHHRNGIPWDNRPENIVPLTPSEHSKVHRGREIVPIEERV